MAEFSVTLFSDSDCNIFHLNSANLFRNRVGVDCTGYKIGLAELEFDIKPLAAKPKTTPTAVVKPIRKILGSTAELSVKRVFREELGFHLNKADTGIGEILTRLNADIAKSQPRVQVQFLIGVVNEETFQVTLRYNDVKDKWLELSPDLGHALGLSGRYPPGTHVGNPFNEQASFRTLKLQTSVSISVCNYTSFKLTVQPATTFHELIINISDAFETQNVEVGILYENLGRSMYVKVIVYESELEFTLSQTLADIFGVTTNFKFQDSRELWLDVSKFPAAPEPAIINKEHDSSTHVIVTCNAVESTPFESIKLPVLRVIPRQDFKQHMIFNPVQFFTAKPEFFHTMQISIVDRDLMVVPVNSKPTSVTLVFRKDA